MLCCCHLRSLILNIIRFVDLVDCPGDIIDRVNDCLNKGVNLLLPSLADRIGKACALLNLKTLSRGEELNLRLILQSLHDPAVVASLLCKAREETVDEEKTFTLIKTLIIRTFHYYVSSPSVVSIMTLMYHIDFVLHRPTDKRVGGLGGETRPARTQGAVEKRGDHPPVYPSHSIHSVQSTRKGHAGRCHG